MNDATTNDLLNATVPPAPAAPAPANDALAADIAARADRKVFGSNQTRLDEWLNRVGAALEWAVNGPAVVIQCYRLNKQRFLVTRFAGTKRVGWELYLAAGGPNNSITQTLDAAELRLVNLAPTVNAAAEGQFPPTVVDRGDIFYRTGKTGTRFADNRAVAEYATQCDTRRTWADANGTVYGD